MLQCVSFLNASICVTANAFSVLTVANARLRVLFGHLEFSSIKSTKTINKLLFGLNQFELIEKFVSQNVDIETSSGIIWTIHSFRELSIVPPYLRLGLKWTKCNSIFILHVKQHWGTFARTWHLYDCNWQNPLQSALVIKHHLMGLHKPIYHPMSKCDFVNIVAMSFQNIYSE